MQTRRNLEKMGMILNPTLTMFIVLIFGVLTLIFVMLLPAFFELKRPRDAGPRRILDDSSMSYRFQLGRIALLDIEEGKAGFDQDLAVRIAGVIAFLPNLEV